MHSVTERRESTQPTRARTAGSTFKNPDGQSSWKLIDEAGGRGFTFGRAQMSEMHSNFLINIGEADAFEVETVGEMIRQKVRDAHNVELRWEVRRMGHFIPGREVREFMDRTPFVGMV
jgi:UDP-N-acetylmuramate dehydrogenase